MKKTYLFETEEILTCNGCVFVREGTDEEYRDEDICGCQASFDFLSSRYIFQEGGPLEVTTHMYTNTKHPKCPLKEYQK